MIWLNNKLFKRILVFIVVFIIIFGSTIIYLNITYPLIYKKLIDFYSKEYDIDPYLVAAIINVESHYNKDAISHKGARGLMQISSTTAYWAAESLSIDDFTLDLLFDPEINIRIGTWYLDVLWKEFDGNLQLILAAYNGGSGNVAKWLENDEYCEDGAYLKKIPFKETEQYVIKVLKNIKMYNILYKDQFNRLIDKDEIKFITVIHNFKRIIKTLILYR